MFKEWYKRILIKRFMRRMGNNWRDDIYHLTDMGNMVITHGKLTGFTYNELLEYLAGVYGKQVEWID